MPFEFIEDADLRAKVESEYKGLVETETSALRVKVDEVLGEKKSLASKLKEFDGLDPKAAKEAINLVRTNEDLLALKDGKTPEVVERAVSRVREEYEAKVGTLQNNLDSIGQHAHDLQQRLAKRTLRETLAKEASKAGAPPTPSGYRHSKQ